MTSLSRRAPYGFPRAAAALCSLTWIIAGCSGDRPSQAGAESLGRERATLTGPTKLWVRTAILSESTNPYDQYGRAVAATDNTLLVGSLGAPALPSAQGIGYAYVRSGTSWVLQQALNANDGAVDDDLGCSVAISGDTALLGARGSATKQGAAYVFVRSGTTWTQQAKLTASDGAPSDEFGYAVAIEGDRALVGAPYKMAMSETRGAVYAYTRTGASWSEQKIEPSSHPAPIAETLRPVAAVSPARSARRAAGWRWASRSRSRGVANAELRPVFQLAGALTRSTGAPANGASRRGARKQ